SILFGGSALTFINIPSLLIVFGGTFLVVMIKFTLKQFLGAFNVAGRAFTYKLDNLEELTELIVKLSTIARKEGLLALEKVHLDNQFLHNGIQMLVDGNDREVI
ncbi:MAG: flagellar motor protein PomA, partial [Porticoccus sp.]